MPRYKRLKRNLFLVGTVTCVVGFGLNIYMLTVSTSCTNLSTGASYDREQRKSEVGPEQNYIGRLNISVREELNKENFGKHSFSAINGSYAENGTWCEEAKFKYPLSIDLNKYQIEDKGIKQIHLHPYEYILNPIRLCSVVKHLNVISLVKSDVSHFRHRNAIRATWGTKAWMKKDRLVFLLGHTTDSHLQEVVYQEFMRFRDTVQEDFIDAYYNLTLKTVMGIRWQSRYCSNARFVFIVDDDILVNYDNLLGFFKGISTEEEKNLFSGNLHFTDLPYRSNTSKWYLTTDEYPFPCFLPFLSGGAILTSSYVLHRINAAIPFVKFLKLDDVFLSIVAHKIGIYPKNQEKIGLDGKKESMDFLITKHRF